jgi:hypothetical protein
MRPMRRMNRRGIAMLLVLISLAAATIITTAYLASRDNSSMIGDNIVNSATARWAAASGVEMGVAILQTDTDWRTAHVNGKLLDDYDMAGVSLDIDIVDYLTEAPPDETSRYIELIATATVDGVTQEARAIAEVIVEGGPTPEVSVDLSEFAVFATEKVDMHNEATITRWPAAPMTDLGRPIAIGTQGVSASTIKLSGSAAIIDATVFTGPSPSDLLIDLSVDNPDMAMIELSDTIPVPAAPQPGVASPEDAPTWDTIEAVYNDYGVHSDHRFNRVLIDYDRNVYLYDSEFVINGDLDIKRSGVLFVQGECRLIVFGDLDINEGSIQVVDGATLEVFVGGTLNIDDGYIGVGPVESAYARDASGGAPYMNPNRLVIYSMPGASTTVNVYELMGVEAPALESQAARSSP